MGGETVVGLQYMREEEKKSIDHIYTVAVTLR